MEYLAAILTGGASSRMGAPKALREAGNATFLGRILDTLGRRFDHVVLVGGERMDGYPEPVPDVVSGAGPLGGIATTLRHAEGANAFVVPVDVPLITVEVIDRLCSPPLLSGQARVARVDGRVQPLVGQYAGDLLTLVEERLSTEDRSMMGLLRVVPHLTLIDITDGSLRNINTPEDYEALIDGLGE